MLASDDSPRLWLSYMNFCLLEQGVKEWPHWILSDRRLLQPNKAKGIVSNLAHPNEFNCNNQVTYVVTSRSVYESLKSLFSRFDFRLKKVHHLQPAIAILLSKILKCRKNPAEKNDFKTNHVLPPLQLLARWLVITIWTFLICYIVCSLIGLLVRS